MPEEDAEIVRATFATATESESGRAFQSHAQTIGAAGLDESTLPERD